MSREFVVPPPVVEPRPIRGHRMVTFNVSAPTVPALEERIRETMQKLGIEGWAYEFDANASIARVDGSVSLLSASVTARH